MNRYIEAVSIAIEYIEKHIDQPLTVGDVAASACISDFHFSRIFKIITDMSIKQYVNARKVTLAARRLACSDDAVIDISMDFGFDSPEVFLRAFKRQFAVSPLQYRSAPIRQSGLEPVVLVEREVMNYGGVLGLKGTCVYMPEKHLMGMSIQTDTDSSSFQEDLTRASVGIIESTSNNQALDQTGFYTVVNCHENQKSLHTVFSGREIVSDHPGSDLVMQSIPEGWYAQFKYRGDMFTIAEQFTDDLYRWLMIKNAQLRHCGIGMVNRYEADYPNNPQVLFYVPIESPVS